jgi:hypothetical protein
MVLGQLHEFTTMLAEHDDLYASRCVSCLIKSKLQEWEAGDDVQNMSRRQMISYAQGCVRCYS